MPKPKPKILPLITHPNPLLQQKSKVVKDVKDKKVQQLILDMIATMRQAKGIGISAVQVGELLRILIVEMKDKPLVLVNPKIYSKSLKKNIDLEGCLSVPGKFGRVKRCSAIKVRSLNPGGKKVDFKAQGLLARVIQHEFDHLQGKLFIDLMEDEEQEERFLRL